MSNDVFGDGGGATATAGDDVFGEGGFFEVPSDGFDSPDDLYSGASAVDKAGFYHVEVAGITPETGSDPTEAYLPDSELAEMTKGMSKDEKKAAETANWRESGDLRCVNVQFRILDGDNLDQKGRSVWRRIQLETWANHADHREGRVPFDPTDEKGKRRIEGIVAAFYALGIITAEDVRKGRPRITAKALEQAELWQCVVKVSEPDEYSDRCRIKWDSDIFPVDHERVKNVPKDGAALAEFRANTGTGSFDPAAGQDDLADI